MAGGGRRAAFGPGGSCGCGVRGPRCWALAGSQVGRPAQPVDAAEVAVGIVEGGGVLVVGAFDGWLLEA